MLQVDYYNSRFFFGAIIIWIIVQNILEEVWQNGFKVAYFHFGVPYIFESLSDYHKQENLIWISPSSTAPLGLYIVSYLMVSVSFHTSFLPINLNLNK